MSPSIRNASLSLVIYTFISLPGITQQNKDEQICCSFPVSAVAINPKLNYGGELATAQGCTVHLWDMGVNCVLKPNRLHGHTDDVTSLDFHPSQDVMASASKDKTVRIWDLILRKERFLLTGHRHWVNQVVFSNNGKLLASCGRDGLLIIWDVATGTMINRFNAGVSLNAIAFNENDSLLAMGADDGSIQLMQVSTHLIVQNYNVHKEPVRSLLFKPGSSLIISGGDDKLIHVYNFGSKKEVAEMKGHTSSVTALHLKSDSLTTQLISGSADESIRIWHPDTYEQAALWRQTGKVLSLETAPGKTHQFSHLVVSGSEDKKVRFWNPASNSNVASLYFTSDGNALLQDKNDYFISAEQRFSREYLNNAANSVTPDEYLELQYNRPDKVLSSLGLYSDVAAVFERAFLKRLNKLGIDTTLLGFMQVPVVSVNDVPLSNSANRKLSISINAFDSVTLLREIIITVNGVPEIYHTGANNKYSAVKTIELSNGRNDIAVFAVNEKGLRSKALGYRVYYTGERGPENLYLVSIGGSKYLDSNQNLRLAAVDANKMAEVMRQQAGFKNIFTYVLTDSMVTKANMFALKQKLTGATTDDVVVFFYSGHGILSKEFNYYLGTTDMDFAAPGQLGFSNDDILTFFHGIPSRRRLVLIDACHSGDASMPEALITPVETSGATRGLKVEKKRKLPTPAELAKSYFKPIENPEGILRLSAASGDEYSMEKAELGGGIFTYSVINAMRDQKTDKDRSELISFDELAQRVQEEVITLTNGKQHPEPNAGSRGGVELFASARSSDTRSPIIDIKEPAIQGRATIVQTKTGTALMRGYVIDESEIKYVTVDNRKAEIKPGGSFETTLVLKEGENTVVVTAEDVYGNKQEKTITVFGKETALNNVGRYYGLFIGVDKYKDESLNLEYPVSDARQLHSVLTKNYQFDSSDIILLENPTRAAILTAFTRLKSKVGPNDNLLVFYAGHGQWKPDEKQGYWLPSDAGKDNEEGTWISNDDVLTKMKAINAKHILLLADACFSGKLLYQTRNVMDSASSSVAETYNMKSRRAITSGALETVPDRSIFIEFLCDYLKNNKERFLYSKKLYVEIKDDVTNRSPSRQKPLDGTLADTGDENGDFIFIRR